MNDAVREIVTLHFLELRLYRRSSSSKRFLLQAIASATRSVVQFPMEGHVPEDEDEEDEEEDLGHDDEQDVDAQYDLCRVCKFFCWTCIHLLCMVLVTVHFTLS